MKPAVQTLVSASLLSLLVVAPLLACSADDSATGEDSMIEDVKRMRKRPDGRFDVTCADGSFEIVTAEQIRQDDVCNGPGPADAGVDAAPGPSSIGRFVCDSSGNLQISIISAAGTEKTGKVEMFSLGRCRPTADVLNRTRRDITRLVLFGACDSSGNLNRFSVTSAGELKVLSVIRTASFSACDAQAADLNAEVAPGTLDGIVGRYHCDSSGNLQMSVMNSAGVEKTGKVEIFSLGRCRQTADTLNQTRRDIRRLVLVGACDSSGNLNRFVITTAGELKALATIQTRSFSTCDAQAADINVAVNPETPEAVIGRHHCDSSGTLRMGLIGLGGDEKTMSVDTFNLSRCRQTADTLNRTRREITRTMLVGACDSSANLHRASITPAGDFQPLSTIAIGSFSSCDAQAADLNQ